MCKLCGDRNAVHDHGKCFICHQPEMWLENGWRLVWEGRWWEGWRWIKMAWKVLDVRDRENRLRNV